MRIGAVVTGCALLVGCSGLTVERETAQTANRKELPGLPFYIKKAVLVQETKVATYDLAISFQVSSTGDFSKAPVLPAAGAVRVPVSMRKGPGRTEAVVGKSLSDAIGANTFPTAGRAVAAMLDALRDLQKEQGGKEYDEEPVANTWKTDTVLDPTHFYIQNRVPAFGSASAEFDLASDGTLTKSSTSITDDTAKSVLALSPITSLLDNLAGVSAAASTASPETESTVSKRFTDVRLNTPPPTYRVLVAVQKIPTVYTLRRVDESRTSCAPSECQPLKRSYVDKTDLGTQLVSVDNGVAKDDKPSYKIAGTITPPDSSK